MANVQYYYQNHKNKIPLLVCLLLSSPVIFFQSFRNVFPLGFAGMFTLITEKIVEANFALPMQIPHYGPGGIDLVYPPFAFYLFAAAMKVGIPSWAYLRFMPAVFTTLSMIPLYYLNLEISRSKAASVIATFLIITAPAVYYTHVWSAGIVRGLALGLCLAGLLFFIRSFDDPSFWRFTLLAGILLGFLLMTHLLYVLFAALFGIAYLLSEWKWRRIQTPIIILTIAFLTATPWLALIIDRHGLSSILIAYSSHGNTGFIESLRDVSTASQFIVGNLEYVTYNRFMTILSFLGFVLLIIRKKFLLPLSFVLVLFMGEASFYVEILSGMIAGIFSADAFQFLSGKYKEKSNTGLSKFLIVLLEFCLSAIIIAASATGINQITKYEPEIDYESIATADFVKNNTSPNDNYLFIGKVNEAEWFPYLFDRTPVFGPWGSEWKGTYTQQSDIVVALRGCELQQDWTCVENILMEENVHPNLLVTPNKRWLTQEIKNTQDWELIFTNPRYYVWKIQE